MSQARDYEALLVLSFGGPEGPDDVLPFLERVTRGRGVPAERLAEVAEHYYARGGVSPINAQVRALIAALEEELAGREIDLPIYWGNRNWEPLVEDTVAAMRDDGVRCALALATSAFSSYSSCRQYLEDIERARAATGAGAPRIDKIRPFWNHPGFLEASAARLREGLVAQGAKTDLPPRVLFTAHSIPERMAENCRYAHELAAAARWIGGAAAPGLDVELVYQSRSGPPSVPWLEPDVCDRLTELASQGVRSVVLAPLGFVSDHMEVVHDLDTEAAAVAAEAGIVLSRAKTVGQHPLFVSGLADLVVDGLGSAEPQVVAGFELCPWPCAEGCCDYTPARSSR